MAIKQTQRPAAGKGQQHRGQQPQTARTSTKPPQEEQSNPIARMGTGENVPARVRQREGKSQSVSKDAADNAVPFIYLLQANSPQCLKGHAKYLEGAVASNIWLRNDPDPFIDGEQGMDFQCCHFSKLWVEWQPERAGLAGRHKDRPADAREVEEEGDDGAMRKAWKRSNGNYVVETRYHVGLVHRRGKPPEPYTLPMSGTGHTVSKNWTTDQNRLDGGRAEWYDVIWTLRTELQSKGQNSWYQYTYEFNRWCTDEEAEVGESLYEAFEAGTKRMEEDEAAGAGDGDGGEGERSSGVM